MRMSPFTKILKLKSYFMKGLSVPCSIKTLLHLNSVIRYASFFPIIAGGGASSVQNELKEEKKEEEKVLGNRKRKKRRRMVK